MNAANYAASVRLSRNTFTLLVSNVGSAPLSFLLSALIGRALGTEGLGAYSAALAWILPLSLLVEFGLSTLMQRELAENTRITYAYLNTVMRVRLLFGSGIMLVLFALAPLLSGDPAVVAGLRISAPMVLILPMFSAFTAVYKAHGAMWPMPYLNIGMLAAQVALTAAALLAGGGIIAVLVLNVATSAGQLVAAWAIYRWHFHRFDQIVVATQIGVLLRRAFPFALAAVFAALQTRLSVILLEQLATTAEVGYFSAAARFVEAAKLVPNAFFGALFPALASLAANHLLREQTFRRGLLGLGAVGVASGIGFTVLAQPLMMLSYGAAFTPAAPVLQVLGWSLLFSNLRGGRTLYLYALGQENRVNRINALVVAVQGGLSLLLIPTTGALGVAIVHGVVEIVALALLWRHEKPSAE